jgi:SAM-dependent methyltransferase
MANDWIMKRLLQYIYFLLYEPFAWTYDWVAAFVSCGHWQEWIRATLPFLPGPCVVELGHGPGHLQIELKKRQITTFGLDASRQMSKIARSNLSKAGLPTGTIIGYAQSLSFATACCDQIAATFPSDYIFDRHTLDEIYRLLKPGGTLVVLLGGWLTGSHPCHRVVGWLLRAPAESELKHLSRWLGPFKTAGFFCQSQIIDLPGSRVLLIVARRVP